MSNNPERLKLLAKRVKKRIDLARSKPSDLNLNYKNPVTSKKDRNMTITGLKRRLSSEGGVSNKKTCLQNKTEVSSEVSKTGNSTKPHDSLPGKNLAKNRLALLRERIKETPSTSKSQTKESVKKSRNVDIDKIQNTIPTDKSDVKSSVRTSTFKIPKKKSANDRLKLAKADLSQETEKKASVVSKSPQKNNYYSKRTHDEVNVKMPTTPPTKLYCKENISEQKIGFERVITECPNSQPERSFRFSEEFIVISEVSSERSARKLTPEKQRPTSIRNRYSSSSSSKTLTPGSPRGPPSAVIEETGFKTPIRPPKVTAGLKIPLNRDLFKSRAEAAVQTERNIFRSPNDVSPKERVIVSAEPSEEIFRVPPHHNIFQSYGATPEKTDNIFASYSPRLNNNDTVSQTNANNNGQISIFGATPQKNIFSNFTAEIQTSANAPVISFPSTSLNDLSDTHRPVYHSEPERRKIGTEPPQIFPLEHNIETSRKSANDRLSRIKNEGCNTYRKKHPSMLHEKNAKNESCEQGMEPEQIMEGFTENPSRQMVGSQCFEDLLPRPSSPSRRQPFIKGLLTEDWLSSHQGTSRLLDETMSDSMLVNVDDTLLNKSDLPEDIYMDWDSVPQAAEIPQPAPPEQGEPQKENIICLVTDTNIFMHFLPKVKDAINIKLTGSQKVKIYVPWMVLKELDHLKDRSGEPTRTAALEAEKFINKCLTGPNSKVIGQTVQEVSRQQDVGTSPDDKILACTMQVKKKYETVILLSNDVNLRNGAIVNGIETSTPQQIIQRLKGLKFCKIRHKLMLLWSEIICECCQQAYGDAWKKMDMLQTPPWSMLECIKRFRKYWPSVFKEVLLKHCQKLIDRIYSFLMEHKGDIDDDSGEFNDFMKLVFDFLLFLQDLPKHKDSIKRNLDEIVEIANS